MIMQTCESGDQFGVNYNYEFILLQTKERLVEGFEESRIKLTIKDVNKLIEELEHFRDRVEKWQTTVGPQFENETKYEYTVRVLNTARENNYFVSRQED
jgi:transcriptional regulatory protein LevR